MRNLAIIGVGLVGGSIGLAVKKRADSVWRITGFNRHVEALIQAKNIGAVDVTTTDLREAVRHADLVVLCAPISVIPSLVRQIRNSLTRTCIVTDVGSTKASIVREGEKQLGAKFVGGHPMAGSEKQGVAFAREDLFEGRTFVLATTNRTTERAKTTVSEFWASLGMRVVELDPRTHDKLVASVSHLPHATATALVNIQSTDSLAISGPGFRDSTRVAAGSPQLWTDIFLDNAIELIPRIEAMQDELGELRRRLQLADRDAIFDWLESGRKSREALALSGSAKQPQYWVIEVRTNKLAKDLDRKSHLWPADVDDSFKPLRRHATDLRSPLMDSVVKWSEGESLDIQLAQKTPTRLIFLVRSSGKSNPARTLDQLSRVIAKRFGDSAEAAVLKYVKDADVLAFERFSHDKSNVLTRTWNAFVKDYEKRQGDAKKADSTLFWKRIFRRLMSLP